MGSVDPNLPKAPNESRPLPRRSFAASLKKDPDTTHEMQVAGIRLKKIELIAYLTKLDKNNDTI